MSLDNQRQFITKSLQPIFMMKWAHRWSLWDSTLNALAVDESLMIRPQSLKWKSMATLRWTISLIRILERTPQSIMMSDFYVSLSYRLKFRALAKAITSWQNRFSSPNIRITKLNVLMKAIDSARRPSRPIQSDLSRNIHRWNSRDSIVKLKYQYKERKALGLFDVFLFFSVIKYRILFWWKKKAD